MAASLSAALAYMIGFAVLVGGCGGAVHTPRTLKVPIGGEMFTLEVAADDASRVRGLMHRSSIDPDGGMIFIFREPSMQGFWMGHCLVDMDIAYLDARGRVTATHTMKTEQPQQPGESDDAYRRRMPQYSSRYPAQFAIELKAGSLKRLGLKAGDRIDLDLKGLKAMAR